jgi:hypothetical protein
MDKPSRNLKIAGALLGGRCPRCNKPLEAVRIGGEPEWLSRYRPFFPDARLAHVSEPGLPAHGSVDFRCTSCGFEGRLALGPGAVPRAVALDGVTEL